MTSFLIGINGTTFVVQLAHRKNSDSEDIDKHNIITDLNNNC